MPRRDRLSPSWPDERVIRGTLGSIARLAKGPSGNNRFLQLVCRSDRIVPFAMELGALDVNSFHFCFGDNDAFCVAVGVEFAVNLQAGFHSWLSRG